MSGEHLRGEVDFEGIDMERSEIMLIDESWSFRNAKINGATLGGLTQTQLYSTASYLAGNLTGVTLHESDFSDCRFSKMNLTGSKFRRCDFTGAVFDDAVITDVEFCVNVGPCDDLTGLTAAQLATTWKLQAQSHEDRQDAESASFGSEGDSSKAVDRLAWKCFYERQ